MLSPTQYAPKGRARQVWLFAHKTLGFAAFLVLFAMMGLTSADVVMRYIFNSPIPGAYELTEVFLVTLIFLALPLATATGEHVEVELYDPRPGTLGFQFTVWIGTAVVFAVLAVMAIELWEHADKLQRRNTVTNSLDLPYYPLGFFTAFASALAGLAVLVFAIARTQRARSAQEPEADDRTA